MAETPVFVARERELARLNQFLNTTLNGQGRVCFVTGEAGSGKTALVTKFASRAQERHTDLVVAIGDCNAQTGIGDPYLPFREVLGLLTGDVEARLAQGAITAENAGRLRDFLRVSGQALLDFGPDLIEAFVPGAGLATRAGAFFAGQVGWLDRLEQLTERKSARPDDTSHRVYPPGTQSGRMRPARGTIGPNASPRDTIGPNASPRDTIGALSTSLEQSDLFAQYTDVLKALASQRPLMLVVDDLQWADTASIALLFHLGRRFGEARIMLVGAYRPDEVALGRGGERHPLERVLAEFKRYFGDVWVDLDHAEEAEGQQFVDAFLDAEPNRLGLTFRQAMFRHTSGHPLFTVELLRDLQERGALVQDEVGRWVEGPALEWGALPARVEGVIKERVDRLDKDLREILSVASVEGEDFTAQVVARVQGIAERQLVRALSQELMKRHRLVQERGVVTLGRQRLFGYQFAHVIFQQYLYDDLSAGERLLLHGEIAEVLEELYQGRTEQITVHLARHYAEAGEAEKAVHYLLQAGDRARGLYAHQEAIDYYERALAFLKEQGEHERAARTLMKLGLTYHIAFDFRRARQAYEEGFALWQRAGETEPAITLPASHVLRVDWGDPPTLDPAMAADVNSTGVIEQTFSGLVQLTLELDVVPDVARTWEVSEGGRKYVFHLRDDARWSDGTPVTAGDFEYAWKRVLHPATGSPNAGLLYDVKGARAFHQGERPDPGRVGVRALDEVTLVVDLEDPTGHFPHLLACSATYPVTRYVSEMDSQEADIVTNGPFRLGTWQRGESMVLVRNPDRRGASVRQN